MDFFELKKNSELLACAQDNELASSTLKGNLIIYNKRSAADLIFKLERSIGYRPPPLHISITDIYVPDNLWRRDPAYFGSGLEACSMFSGTLIWPFRDWMSGGSPERALRNI
jgi:hypothetical protein